MDTIYTPSSFICDIHEKIPFGFFNSPFLFLNVKTCQSNKHASYKKKIKLSVFFNLYFSFHRIKREKKNDIGCKRKR